MIATAQRQVELYDEREAFRAIWNEANFAVSDCYEDGCGEFIAEHHPELAADISAAREDMNRFMHTDLTAFEEAARNWKQLTLYACRLYEMGKTSWQCR